jgi:hypothetical protein
MCRPESPDPGAVRDGMAPRLRTACANKHSSNAQSNACALCGMHPDDCQHRSVLYHLRHTRQRQILQTRTGRSQRTPCHDRLARSAGSPRPATHRASPTPSWSSRTERVHSSKKKHLYIYIYMHLYMYLYVYVYMCNIYIHVYYMICIVI